jgi:transcriptional regulator with XRE-family HTH domain
LRLNPEQAGQDRKVLASALRKLRKASGLPGDRLAARCGMSQSKISRIETGRMLPSVVDVQQILNALGVDQETSGELLRLAHVANAEYQDVRASIRRGLYHRQRELASLEANAHHFRHFLPALITGLLQTPEYMRAALDTPVQPATGDTSKVISMKLERQAILHDRSKRFDFLLTESAVRWQLCEPSVMALQVDHLVAVSRLPSVRIGVIPLSALVPDGAFHTFVIYDEHLVTVELFTGQLVQRDPKDIGQYRELFDFFASRALFDNEARTFLRAVSDEFMRVRD